MKITKAKYCTFCGELYNFNYPYDRCQKCGRDGLKIAIAEVNKFFVAQDAEIISCEPLKKQRFFFISKFENFGIYDII